MESKAAENQEGTNVDGAIQYFCKTLEEPLEGKDSKW